MRISDWSSDVCSSDLLTSHQVVRLVTDGDGAVLGVEALNDGKEVSFGARKGVIFATGGFTYNREMLNLHQTGPVYGGCGVPTNTGDFVSIAGAVGAKLGNMGSAWRAEIRSEEGRVGREWGSEWRVRWEEQHKKK